MMNLLNQDVYYGVVNLKETHSYLRSVASPRKVDNNKFLTVTEVLVPSNKDFIAGYFA